MNSKEMAGLITANGMHPVTVGTFAPGMPDMVQFRGTLDEYWAATKALGAKAVFMLVRRVTEADFDRPVPFEDLERVAADEEHVDGKNYIANLETAKPSMSGFLTPFGKDHSIVLRSMGGFAGLECLVTEDWWEKFHAEAEEAVKLWIANHRSKPVPIQTSEMKKEVDISDRLRSLIFSPKFCALETPESRRAHAIETIPELEEWTKRDLDREIQSLVVVINMTDSTKESRV